MTDIREPHGRPEEHHAQATARRAVTEGAGRRAVAEGMARWAAGNGALPHFLFRPEEPGATLLLSGERGVMVQVVRRTEPNAWAVREQAWLAEQVAAAGRRLDQGWVGRQWFGSERGGRVEVDPAAVTWSGVLLVDHPALPPGVQLVREAARGPLVVFLRRDWELLLHELRSAAAVVRCLDWLAGRVPGEEVPAHFAWLTVAADLPARMPAGPLPEMPLLVDDLPGHAVISRMLEYVAAGSLDEAVRHRLLSLIDGFPLEHRAGLGDWAAEAIHAGGAARVRTFSFPGSRCQYVLAVAGSFSEALAGPFDDLVQLRHHEARKRSLSTFGFVLVPDAAQPGWPYLIAHFTWVQGPVDLTPDDLSRIRTIWSDLPS
ncbi:hypothetical protein [Actinoplanes sp. GCM10030250]|uniref:hypothetical protein n=1 Tax=Actinoplanes sp. GCM10030250 TaxID=3273376 RepID=UPI00360C68F5